jgi:hypothetical protein
MKFVPKIHHRKRNLAKVWEVILATMEQAGSKEGICVGIRMRPLNEREISSGQVSIFRCLPHSNTIAQFKDGATLEGQCYSYDKVFDETSSTEAVYAHTCADIVKGVANGINGTVFACKHSIVCGDAKKYSNL